MRLLLIEDSEFDHYRLEKYLQHIDVEIIWARTSEQAVELLRSGEFDAVLADQIIDGKVDHRPLLQACKKPVLHYSGLAMKLGVFSKVHMGRIVEQIEKICATERKT